MFHIRSIMENWGGPRPDRRQWVSRNRCDGIITYTDRIPARDLKNRTECGVRMLGWGPWSS